MQINKFNTKEQVLIIAEIGNNHEGSYTLAEELVGLAREAGVDAVKFQTYKTEYYVSHQDKDRFNKLKSFELTQNEFEKLGNFAREQNLIFISTPFDNESALFLSTIVDAIKISSGDNNFYPLIETIAESKLPLLLSTGLADLNQIIKTKGIIDSIWGKLNIIGELAILHCVSSYPVKPKFANLKAIQTLIHSLDCTVGYSDHTLGIHASTVAVGLGARIIEKHFTKNKQFSDFRDHQLSADVKEMKQMVKIIREIEQMLGSGKKIIQQPEEESSITMRRSIVAKHALPKGSTINWDNITWTRPGGGLSPGEESVIIGKKLNQPINEGAQILSIHLD